MGVMEKVNHPPLAPPLMGGEYLVAEGLIECSGISKFCVIAYQTTP